METAFQEDAFQTNPLAFQVRTYAHAREVIIELPVIEIDFVDIEEEITFG